MVAESGKREKTAQNLTPVGAGDGPRWLSHRNAETGGLRVTVTKPAPAIAHSPNQPEYHPETARKVQKPYRKPSGKPFKTSNNRPNLHMVGAYADRKST